MYQDSARRPVSRVLCPTGHWFTPRRAELRPDGRPGGDHLSSPGVAAWVERPTRGRAPTARPTESTDPKASGPGVPYPPTRPCTGWGLPCRRCLHRRGELLPHHFTLIPIFIGTVYFLWHFPAGRPAPLLAGILPGGARTFLPPSEERRRSPGHLALLRL